MKKRIFIFGGFVLLLLVFFLLKIDNPRYLTLEIPMPQTFPRYEGYYAEEEEFSTRVLNVGYGESYNYYVYSMYVSVSLREQGFDTEQDVENYYDTWLKKLGWEEARTDLCNPYMKEFQPIESYRAYTHPDNFATACMATWFIFGDEEYLAVMIKTINPSWEVSWDLD